MTTNDYQELSQVSTKEYHVLSFWRKALIECFTEKGPVSAGQVGKHVGQSRTTAKKYLDRLKSEKIAETKEEPYKNGITMTLYRPARKSS